MCLSYPHDEGGKLMKKKMICGFAAIFFIFAFVLATNTVVLADEKGTCVGVAHAGWRGLANGVIQALVNAMDRHVHPVYAWLGPAIGPDHFEVGEDVYDIYRNQHAAFAEAFTAIHAEKWNLNLYRAAKIILSMSGVKRIYGGTYCTYEQDKLFYSYRRQGKTGRCATLIWIR